MSKTYIGITISPIDRTFRAARKTRELWAASYLFSYLMRLIIKSFHEKGRRFVVPFVDDEVLKMRNGVGMFPDQCIFESRDNDFEELPGIVHDIITRIVANFGNEDYVRSYLQASWCQISTDSDKDAVLVLKTALDTIEQMPSLPTPAKGNIINEALKESGGRAGFLFDDANRKKGFPSIFEIATKDISDDLPGGFFDSDEDDNIIYDRIVKEKRKKNKDFKLKKHYKYIAIVKADGDNLGNAIKKCANDQAFSAISLALFEFSKNAHKLIEEYNGTTVYAGGDDLLFFAPVKFGSETIFTLINELGKAFQVPGGPTLSFGLSITYNKFPLYEALALADELLFDAKKKGGRNAVAIALVKHSGMTTRGVFSKKGPLYDKLEILTKESVKGKVIPTSLIHTLLGQEEVLALACRNSTTASQRIENFLRNSFDEGYNKALDFMISLVDLIPTIYAGSGRKEQAALLETSLRTVAFLQED
ncbi:MAG: type III-B CRISPR-associated protein Cas10/Cmr2 [Candidatus Aminicenantes bacterium]|nr:type III-B CRISPR-associated protein Cas10/Cmr2 [Candidatus Aminicenantes bacterium]